MSQSIIVYININAQSSPYFIQESLQSLEKEISQDKESFVKELRVILQKSHKTITSGKILQGIIPFKDDQLEDDQPL